MDHNVVKGPDVPGINYRGSEWGVIEEWLAEQMHETYRHLAHRDTSWEETLILRGQASFIERMLNLPNIAATFYSREA